MNLILDPSLSEPPSSVTLFRDVTLVASVLCEMPVFVECERGTRSLYLKWLRKHGAMDYVEDIVLPNECVGLNVGPKKKGIPIDSLDYGSWDFLTSCLFTFRK